MATARLSRRATGSGIRASDPALQSDAAHTCGCVAVGSQHSDGPRPNSSSTRAAGGGGMHLSPVLQFARDCVVALRVWHVALWSPGRAVAMGYDGGVVVAAGLVGRPAVDDVEFRAHVPLLLDLPEGPLGALARAHLLAAMCEPRGRAVVQDRVPRVKVRLHQVLGRYCHGNFLGAQRVAPGEREGRDGTRRHWPPGHVVAVCGCRVKARARLPREQSLGGLGVLWRQVVLVEHACSLREARCKDVLGHVVRQVGRLEAFLLRAGQGGVGQALGLELV
mmetsp:Transcript_17369/g.50496  ORF Transcript_17369/g.50496 Transcript_17369/m.50496 type:complete len:278 (-) Transcript_17369:266-1099(-)|eukprot:CAMPEP_0206035200 /NCGR_PEP_ID=MMETSP1466-20131121/1912_1 /ASSEMBLY_ACC=CAM_ASM_001126 /TAXON_ID=44452 /ORGANISM="Pavlova gyrans, Strain CCMP608" /LENGTH=277 /DNA_ID=CAMNT_0053409553 /DNA_START=27 /DNA_END=860 /DNA_ORIENTATION=+